MAAAGAQTDADLITCGVCFNQYDLEDRKPKFLRCSHTLCLPCAKVGVIYCPFCQRVYCIKSVDSLPNNNYATQLLELMGMSKQTLSETAPSQEVSVHWCADCQKIDNWSCKVLGHLTINITSETLKNLEQTIQLKTELIKMKSQGIDTLTQVIQKREQIQEHLSLVKKSILFIENQVKELEDVNNFMLAKFTSILESNNQPPSTKTSEVGFKEKDDKLISDFSSIVNDFHPEDTMGILKLKLKKTLDVYDEYLKEATSVASNYERLENMKMTVVLNNQTEAPILTLDLTKKNRSRQEVMLLSQTILSLLGNQSALIPTSALTTSPKSVSPPSSFVLGQSNFILKVYRLGVAVDEIWIQPCTTFDNEFIQKLGIFCYNSPKKLDSSIKAVADVYTTLLCAHAFPNYVFCAPSAVATKALEDNEVGLDVVKVVGKNTAAKIEWKMVFPLKKFNDSKFTTAVACHKAKLFGKVIKSKPETITKLSSISIKERSEITFTLESV